MPRTTILQDFLSLEASGADQNFLNQPFGDRWESYTYKEVGSMARKLATYLKGQNLSKDAKIGLVSKNCREWIIADLAIMMAGYISVPFFATLTGDQIATVLELGEVELLIVGKMEVWDDMKNGVPQEMPIVKFPYYNGNSKIERGTSWEEIMNNQMELQELASPGIDDLWTIIFTSGTTGTPKGVMHTYSTVGALLDEAFKHANPTGLDKVNGNNRFFSFLPLNHIAERAVIEASVLRYGGEIYFAESLDTFAKNLQDAQPTTFFAVPRIWTKFRQGILSKLPQKKLSLFLKIPILSSIIKKKLVKAIGLQSARSCISGAAPIPQETKDWFKTIGIGIAEGYGMTETCAALSFLFADEDKPGSVGKPLVGTDVKLSEENSEILMKASYMMTGYYKEPVKTAETIVDGWLHTGDQGKFDEDGYLYITGRVKDTFKTSKAKFIVPSEIEDKFSSCTDIDQMCLLGLGMPQPILIIVPSENASTKDKESLKASLNDYLKEVNNKLPNYKKISSIVIAKEVFSVENDLLTPTLKVKRPNVHNRYKDHLLSYCEAEDMVIFE